MDYILDLGETRIFLKVSLHYGYKTCIGLKDNEINITL